MVFILAAGLGGACLVCVRLRSAPSQAIIVRMSTRYRLRERDTAIGERGVHTLAVRVRDPRSLAARSLAGLP
jgi:hypothetical protein